MSIPRSFRRYLAAGAARRKPAAGTLALAAAAYFLTLFALVTPAQAAATACTSVPFQCISEMGAGKTYAGQVSTTHAYRGVTGAFSATSTTLTTPAANGFAHWFGLTNLVPPPGYTIPNGGAEWMQAGIANGPFNNNGGYSASSTYHWYTEINSYCISIREWHPAGAYTPDNTYTIEVSQTGGTYDCGVPGLTLHSTKSYLAGSLHVTRYLLDFSEYRTDVNTEYHAYDWMNPVGRVCFGSASATTACNTASSVVRRSIAGTWTDWDGSNSSLSSGNGYNRNTQITNYRFNVSSTY